MHDYKGTTQKPASGLRMTDTDFPVKFTSVDDV